MSGGENNKVTCENFQDRLDALASGLLSEAERENLARHAQACPDCEILWRLHGHLQSPSQEELEAQVPEAMVEGMWRDVSTAIAPASQRRSWWSWWPRRWQGRGLLEPALAAAVVLLVFTSGFLLGELRSVRQREMRLTGELQQQERFLAGMQYMATQMSAGARDMPAVPLDWQRMLAGRREVSVAELRTLLARLPANAIVLHPSQLRSWQRQYGHWQGLYQRTLNVDVDLGNGLQAGEALALLTALDLDPDLKISGSRLLSLADRLSRS